MDQISHQLPVHVINFFHHKISLGFVFFISVPRRDLEKPLYTSQIPQIS